MSTNLPTLQSGRVYTTPSWLQSATPGHSVPVDKGTVQDALAAARRSLEVCAPEELAVLLAEMFTIFERPDNWASQSALYIAALEDIPADLVRKALQHVVKTYEFKFPKPASIRKPIEEELAGRVADVKRLEGILQQGRFNKLTDRRERTPEETAAGLEQFAKMKAILNGTTESLKA